MAIAPAKSELLARVRGTLILVPRATGLDGYVREDYRNLYHYPKSGVVDVRLPSWEVGGTVVVALLFQIARKQVLTFQTWLNAQCLRDTQILAALRGDGDIMLYIISEQGRRAIHVPNVVRRDAIRIAGELRNGKAGWSPEQFDAACRAVDQQYPTAAAMYRAVTGQ